MIRLIALIRAIKTSKRFNPNEYFLSGSFSDIFSPAYPSMRYKTSERLWPASEMRARLPDRFPLYKFRNCNYNIKKYCYNSFFLTVMMIMIHNNISCNCISDN